ncbi:N-acetylmuramoyl-L-alanine amidase [Priestia veravalensis]|uniref:N-acetylmuramoyl-L-alanine amidase n=2 Tax=Priestia TaxID=2800373 RepID=A0A0V8JNM2_9BACI|nr:MULTISPECIES: peptidoglycan-binding protein [Priestia]KSU88645.1 N-acetylmuramoyl-L-alanine amidase [Priestia veravalensis]SCC07229.1 Lipoprotein-anchoring transpeptidase ErfK/SrfK [Priestia flexa]
MAKQSTKVSVLFLAVILVVGTLFFSVNKTEAAGGTTHFIVINKANNQLAYYKNNKLVRTFSVATGRTNSLTPEGKFRIVNKIVNRPYYTGKIPGGDPRNPLGNRWLGINARGTNGTTYAIHGNNNPSSIGKYISSGCVRMYDNEVEWLFSQVTVGTPVVITNSSKSFDAIAAANGYKVSGSSQPSQPAVSGLKKGSRGNEVRTLQQKLTSLGYDTKGVDGIFGNNTDTALRRFQKDRGLSVNGVVDSATQKALNGAKPGVKPPATSTGLKKGSRGNEVRALQQKLTSLGFSTKGIDGVFGNNTDAALRQFQKARGLSVTGVVDAATQKALNGTTAS